LLSGENLIRDLAGAFDGGLCGGKTWWPGRAEATLLHFECKRNGRLQPGNPDDASAADRASNLERYFEP
jgi:hypothetical protein